MVRQFGNHDPRLRPRTRILRSRGGFVRQKTFSSSTTPSNFRSLFYDGSSARRSLGPAEQIGTIAPNGGGTVPPIGSTIELLLTSPYTGPLNENILIGGANYVALSAGTSTASNGLLIEKLYDTNANVAGGSGLVMEPGNLG